MSDNEIIRSWKDPDAGLADVLSPVGPIELADLTGGVRHGGTEMPFFCEQTLWQGSCPMGPTRGCCP